MTEYAIRGAGVGKRYVLRPRERYGSLRDTLMAGLRAPFTRGRREKSGDEIWALKDVSFEIGHGEAVGLIGHNGAGKSTLLKILSRITEPTVGELRIRGRVGSLLEVGTGFHPELSGRENVYLNGAILGMRRAEIDRKFDEIVAFAEVERFLSTPVKHYSSGMYMRLAFAVAAHLEPEVLLVDEVLAVGDAAFQRKCLGKMGEVARQGRTVVLVSHNMGAIKTLCRRALWVSHGKIVEDGPPERVVVNYLNSTSEGFAQRKADPNEQLAIERVVLKNARGETAVSFRSGEDITVEIHFLARARIRQPYFWISVAGAHGDLFVASMLFDGHRPDSVEGAGSYACTFKAPSLVPQTYTVSTGARASDVSTPLMQSREVAFFNIIGKMSDYGLHGESADMFAQGSTSMVLPYRWRLPDGRELDVRMSRSQATVDE